MPPSDKIGRAVCPCCGEVYEVRCHLTTDMDVDGEIRHRGRRHTVEREIP